MQTKVLIVIFVSVLSIINLQAKGISPRTATTVAKNFFSTKNQKEAKDIQVKQTFAYTNSNNIVVYIVTFKESGYVMVAGDDNMQPIIAYGLENEIPTLSGKDDLHPMLQRRLNKTQSQQQLRRSNVDPAIQELWKLLEMDDYKKTNNSKVLNREVTNAVTPMVQTLWKQGSPYNKNHPTLNGTKTLTGCMPTAIAQIMKYHNHPAQGTGNISHYWERGDEMLDVDFSEASYDWSAMPNSLTSSSSTTAENEVSTLMYHVAVAIEANFGRDQDGGTDASAIYIEDALGDYFGYDKGSMYAAALAGYTTSEWKNLIVSELDAARPVLYTGQDGNLGHAFVCDGYDFTNGEYFHINWGWGGILNGYFLLNNLDTDGNIWDDNNLVIVGIQPDPSAITPVEPPVIQKADLTIENINTSNTSVLSGGNVTLTSVVKNIGNVQCELSSRVKYYISTDNTLSSDDNYVGYDYVGKLNANATSSETIDVTFGSDMVAGDYYILLLADGTTRVDELDENNVFSIAITLNGINTPSSMPLADLVPDYSELNKTSAAPNTYVYAYCELSNLGTAKSAKSYMRYYLSTDQQWDGNDKYLGYDVVGGIEPAAWGWEEINFKIPATTADGAYYILFVADASNKVDESDENNNVRSEAIMIASSNTRMMTNEQSILDVNVFPNPVTDYLTFTYKLETAGEVSIGIFNLEGKLVKTLVSQYQEAGEYQNRWADASLDALPSGTYITRIEVNGIVEAVKLMK